MNNKRLLLLPLFVGVVYGAKPTPPAAPIIPPLVTEAGPAFTWKAVEDDNGGFYLLWTHQDPGTPNIRVLGQHITAQGNLLWTQPGQTFLSVVPDTGAWTAFSDSSQGLALAWAQDHKVWAQRWAPDGQPLWKTPIQVSDTRYVASSPAGVADGGGGLYVVWREKIKEDRAVLMAQHLNAQSAPLWPVAIRVSLRPSDQSQPAVAYDGAAGMILSWDDYYDFASEWRVQRLNYQGFRLWGLEGIEMAAPAGSGNTALRIAPWGQGSLTVAWVDAINGQNQVQNRQISPKGIPLSDNPARASSLTGDQWNPVLTGDGAGHFWVGWEDNRNQQNWKIYLRNGGPDIPLSSATSGDQGRLALAEDNAQGVYAAWVENRKSAPSLYMQHLDADAHELLDPGGREVAQNLKHPDTPAVLILAPNHAVVIWSDQPAKGRHALYWQLL